MTEIRPAVVAAIDQYNAEMRGIPLETYSREQLIALMAAMGNFHAAIALADTMDDSPERRAAMSAECVRVAQEAVGLAVPRGSA